MVLHVAVLWKDKFAYKDSVWARKMPIVKHTYIFAIKAKITGTLKVEIKIEVCRKK